MATSDPAIDVVSEDLALVNELIGRSTVDNASAVQDSGHAPLPDGLTATPPSGSDGPVGVGAASNSESVDPAGGSPMKHTTTGHAASTGESVEKGSVDTVVTDSVRHAQRPANVPPGQANDQRSPATVAESGGGGTTVPPAAPDLPAPGDCAGGEVRVDTFADRGRRRVGGAAGPVPVTARSTGSER